MPQNEDGTYTPACHECQYFVAHDGATTGYGFCMGDTPHLKTAGQNVGKFMPNETKPNWFCRHFFSASDNVTINGDLELSVE